MTTNSAMPFQLARMLRRTWPSKHIVFGGTAISQLYKYMQNKARMKDLFTLCDAIVIGEGETAI
jgi:anaerobic magnesium-protoporphyrin IX monomethyl ester cyclase